VERVDPDGVTFRTPAGIERLSAKTVLWAGGVAASDLGVRLAARTGAETDRMGRIRVNPDLTIPGHPAIYVVGDWRWPPARRPCPVPRSHARRICGANDR
jgi:NADH dehydrogenase